MFLITENKMLKPENILKDRLDKIEAMGKGIIRPRHILGENSFEFGPPWEDKRENKSVDIGPPEENRRKENQRPTRKVRALSKSSIMREAARKAARK